jgi:hypothetical protein
MGADQPSIALTTVVAMAAATVGCATARAAVTPLELARQAELIVRDGQVDGEGAPAIRTSARPSR